MALEDTSRNLKRLPGRTRAKGPTRLQLILGPAGDKAAEGGFQQYLKEVPRKCRSQKTWWVGWSWGSLREWKHPASA